MEFPVNVYGAVVRPGSDLGESSDPREVGTDCFDVPTKQERRGALHGAGWLVSGFRSGYAGLQSWLRSVRSERERAAARLTSRYRRYLALSQGME